MKRHRFFAGDGVIEKTFHKSPTLVHILELIFALIESETFGARRRATLNAKPVRVFVPFAPAGGTDIPFSSHMKRIMQRATSKLRALIKRGDFLELPSAYDPIIARLAESLDDLRAKPRQSRRPASLQLPAARRHGLRRLHRRHSSRRRAVSFHAQGACRNYYRIEREAVEKLYRKKGAKGS